MFKHARYFYAVIAAFLTVGLVMYTHQSHTATQPLGRHIIDAHGNPAPDLKELVKAVTGDSVDNKSVQELVDFTQHDWLRKPGTERWQMQEIAALNNKDAVMVCFKKLELLNTIAPTKKVYDYCIVFGSAATSMRKRIAYAFALYKQGIICKRFVFLGGQRPLDPTQESKEILCDRTNNELPVRDSWQEPQEMPTNETELIKFLLDQTEIPASINPDDFVFVHAPMKTNPNGTPARPTTGDTMHHWLATNPAPGSCLFVSSQPYVGYQDSVARTFMPDTFTIETVGAQSVDTNDSISVLLDTVARWLYQENLRLKQH